MSQCEGQNPEPVTFKNLIVHFDQGKFEKLLSKGSPVLHTRKYRKVSMAKVSEQKPALAGQVTGRASSQLLLASREASQVPCEPKSPLPKQMRKPKQKAPCKASGAATPQTCLSREDKDKMSACFAETISRKARAETLHSLNPGAVTPRANLVLTSEVAGGVISTALVSQGTREV